MQIKFIIKRALIILVNSFVRPCVFMFTVELLPLEQRSLLKWKISSVTPNVVKHTITRSHFKVTKSKFLFIAMF